MQVIEKVDQMRQKTNLLRNKSETIGLVPTMGYLHRGHLNLIEKSREQCTKVIISIFVNPTQFGPGEDLDKYPRDFEKDYKAALESGVDYIFKPDASEIYGEDYRTFVTVRGLNKIMCGSSRPLHFDGVCTVVLKLFNIIQPHKAYFGRKDYQQLVIIKKMIRDLNIPIDIVECPIVREADGLAMSSRNKYLNDKERKDATVLYRCLKTAAELIKNGNTDIDKIKKNINGIFNETPSVKEVDYFDFRDPEDLTEIDDIEKHLTGKPGCGILIASAIRIGSTRIIDNIIYKPDRALT